ncbi:MAG TPA: tRNA pseudouridine(55) synthase TruB [Elusimicrobia bacterium]|nr:tRNA pseudouridine(55) synthase TruB [Elusimicrobiota bacterium]
MTQPEGLLLVDKPRGWTSHDVVARARRALGRSVKVGHSGTLDPMATGLLILLIGRATKAAARYQALPKVYTGTIRFGVETDTGDLDGKVLKETPLPPALDEAGLRAAFARHLGDCDMPVPRYSAVKHQGKPLYKYARQGIEVPEKVRRSRIHEWTLSGWAAPEAAFRLRCGSGTYVRSLAILLGGEFGCGATLSTLRREEVGGFAVGSAVSIEKLDEAVRSPLPLKALEEPGA